MVLEGRVSPVLGGRVSPVLGGRVSPVLGGRVSPVLLSPGGGDPEDVPVLEVKLGAVVALLSVSLLVGFTPLCLFRGAGRCSLDPDLRRLISCFCSGVFLATCLLDLLPDYLQTINEAFSDAGVTLQFPLPEFILAMGFFLVLVLEQAVQAFKDPSSPPRVEECRALLADSGVVGRRSQRRRASQESDGGSFPVDSGSRSALRVFILVFSLSLHSVFEGLAVGLRDHGKAVPETCLALILHQSLVSFSLAFQLSQGRLRRAAVSGCLLLFAAMSPIGVGVGVALRESRAPPQHRLARCTLEGLAAGTFVYITFMEILPRELGSGGNRVLKVAMLLAGFAVVTGVLFIKL